NTIANPRGDLKVITTQSGVSYDGPTIPATSSPLPKEVKREPEAKKDKVQTTSSGSTAHVQPLVVQHRGKANNQMLKFLHIFQRLHFDLNFADALLHMPKFASTFKSLLSNKEKLFELANNPLNENCLAVLLKKLPEKLGDPGKFLIPCDFLELDECLALADLKASINLMPLFIWKNLLLLELTPTRMTLKLANQSVAYSVGVAEYVFVKVRKFHFMVDFVIDDYDVDPGSPHSREAFLEDNTIINRYVTCEEYAQEVLGFLDSPKSGNPTPSLDPIIITSFPSLIPFEGDEENARLLKVLKSHKHAISWKISDIKGIDPQFCTHKILMEGDFKPTVQHQRRVNLKIHEVIKKEVIKLLDAKLIYLISDSPWVSPIHCVPKKGGMTVVTNEDNELIPTRLFTGWRVCIDYQKLNDATRKDHFSLPFIDQMLEQLAKNEYYCFLDGFSGHF
nr:reverse transcriptase domain-containing protein [Tanacetum cinerariifolium]